MLKPQLGIFCGEGFAWKVKLSVFQLFVYFQYLHHVRFIIYEKDRHDADRQTLMRQKQVPLTSDEQHYVGEVYN